MATRAQGPIGARIAAARHEAGITQARLARLAALDRTAVSKIERGRRSVGSLELARIARALEHRIEWFLAAGSAPRRRLLLDLRRRRRAIASIAARHGGYALRVFGSVARGDARPDSDIDLLIRMEHGRGLFDQAAMIVDLSDLLGRDVDVVTEEGLRDRIRDRVLREAVPL